MTLNKATTCCFTGHRIIPKYLYEPLRSALLSEIERSVLCGYDTFVSGAALGFDMMAAEAVLELKEKYPHIKLKFAVPCTLHDAKWPTDQRLRLCELYKRCDDLVILSQGYTDSCMLDRNRYMVDNSSHCISYCTKFRSGTGFTVRYAAKNGVRCTELSAQLTKGTVI